MRIERSIFASLDKSIPGISNSLKILLNIALHEQVRVLAYKAIKLVAAPLFSLFVVAQVGLYTKPECVRMPISSMP